MHMRLGIISHKGWIINSCASESMRAAAGLEQQIKSIETECAIVLRRGCTYNTYTLCNFISMSYIRTVFHAAGHEIVISLLLSEVGSARCN